MFMIIYNTQTNRIVHWQFDNSTNPITAQQAFDLCPYDKTDLTFVEIAKPENNIEIFKTLFNPLTKEVYSDPAWIDPPRVETASIPVSGS
jgi:hypothetical protein